jgi:hypothetical protein
MIAIDPYFRHALISYGAVLLLCGAGALLGIYFLAARAIKHAHPNSACGGAGRIVGCPNCKTPEILHAKHRT